MTLLLPAPGDPQIPILNDLCFLSYVYFSSSLRTRSADFLSSSRVLSINVIVLLKAHRSPFIKLSTLFSISFEVRIDLIATYEQTKL